MSQVSVIIPTFNRSGVLSRALNSLLMQSFQNWELIVIDDGSTDSTAEVFAAWKKQNNPQQKVHFERVENGGVSRSRNLGARLAASPWLAFLDSDDEWLPEKLEKQIPLSTNFQFIHAEEIWIRRGVRVNAMKKYAKAGGRIFSRAVDRCCISPSTVMIHRELFLNSGGFREDYPVCEDYELWLRLTSHLEVGFVETPLIVKYGGHSDQLSLRYHAMDYFRVRALEPFLRAEHLTLTERRHVATTIMGKADILLRGYRKHQNLARYTEVENYRQSALNALTQFHSTHSATERFPRSEDKLSL